MFHIHFQNVRQQEKRIANIFFVQVAINIHDAPHSAGLSPNYKSATSLKWENSLHQKRKTSSRFV